MTALPPRKRRGHNIDGVRSPLPRPRTPAPPRAPPRLRCHVGGLHSGVFDSAARRVRRFQGGASFRPLFFFAAPRCCSASPLALFPGGPAGSDNNHCNRVQWCGCLRRRASSQHFTTLLLVIFRTTSAAVVARPAAAAAARPVPSPSSPLLRGRRPRPRRGVSSGAAASPRPPPPTPRSCTPAP